MIPGFQVGEREFPKRCNTCGRVFNPVEWRALKHIGDQPMLDAQGREGTEVLELRDCHCGSTLCLHLVQEEDTHAGPKPTATLPPRPELLPYVPPDEAGAWVDIGREEAVWIQASTGLPTLWRGRRDPNDPRRHALGVSHALSARVELVWELSQKAGDFRVVPIRFV
jgi:hypothetical protein